MIYLCYGNIFNLFFGIHKDFFGLYSIYLEYPLSFRSIPMVAIQLGVYMWWIDPNGHYCFSNLNREKNLINFILFFTKPK